MGEAVTGWMGQKGQTASLVDRLHHRFRAQGRTHHRRSLQVGLQGGMVLPESQAQHVHQASFQHAADFHTTPEGGGGPVRGGGLREGGGDGSVGGQGMVIGHSQMVEAQVESLAGQIFRPQAAITEDGVAVEIATDGGSCRVPPAAAPG